MSNAMTTRPHVVLTAQPQLHSTATHTGRTTVHPALGPVAAPGSIRASVLTPRRISYPQIRRTIFGRERLRTRKDAPGAVRTSRPGAMHRLTSIRWTTRRSTTMDKLLLTSDEAAQVLGIGRSKVYELLASRQLGSVKIGTCRRIPADALRAYVLTLTELAS